MNFADQLAQLRAAHPGLAAQFDSFDAAMTRYDAAVEACRPTPPTSDPLTASPAVPVLGGPLSSAPLADIPAPVDDHRAGAGISSSFGAAA